MLITLRKVSYYIQIRCEANTDFQEITKTKPLCYSEISNLLIKINGIKYAVIRSRGNTKKLKNFAIMPPPYTINRYELNSKEKDII